VKSLQKYQYYDYLVENQVVQVQVMDTLPGMVQVKAEGIQKWLHKDQALLKQNPQY
jgi:hypothetical protein